VVAHRLLHEYGVECQFENIPISTARWISGPKDEIDKIKVQFGNNIALDSAEKLAYLAPNLVNLELTMERFPKLNFSSTREH